MNLSSAQRRVLERLRDGEVLHHLVGREPCCFFKANERRVNWSTIDVLRRAEFIVPQTSEMSLNYSFRITPTGLRALEAG